MFLLPRAPVSAVGTAFVSCRHICLIIMSHSLLFCFLSQINLIRFEYKHRSDGIDITAVVVDHFGRNAYWCKKEGGWRIEECRV